MPPTVPPPASIRPPGIERRKDPRAPIELKVEYKRLNSFFADYTRNISKDGTFIATSRPLPIGTEFVFKLTIPKIEPLSLHGRVAWTVSEAQATPEQAAGMGIRFEYVSDRERAEVHGVVQKLMAESLGAFLSEKLLSEGQAQSEAKPPKV